MDLFKEEKIVFKLTDEEVETFCKLINGVYENSTLSTEIGFSVKNKINLDDDVEALVSELVIKLGIVEIEEEK